MSGDRISQRSPSCFTQFLGRTRGKRWGWAFCLLLGGCAQSVPPPSVVPPSPPPQAHMTLVREAKAEAQELRSALAAQRIQAAKQAAELHAARQQAAALREREAEYLQRIASLEADLASLKAEREQLHQTAKELELKVKNLPALLQVIQELRTIQATVQDLMTSLKTVTTDLADIKQTIRTNQTALLRLTGSSSADLKSPPLPPASGQTITVRPGDSLWRLARAHGTTVAILKQLNGLSGDQIIVGQILKLPGRSKSVLGPSKTSLSATP
ncbi:MAG: LysM peptidoglycan-binding domain-containing protein [Nitrospirae bacterium]|nr:MAG: LysM peptidoglycan-binding domain-containing protein [Nitrospirota bacterium]